MDTSSPANAIERLLTALEYETRKEDPEFTQKLLDEFGLPRLAKRDLVERIVAAPGFEPFFLAVVREVRPFAVMLKEVYALLSRYGTTAERRASVFRVSGAGARTTFDFDLESFPKEVLRWIGEIEGAIKVLQLQFGSKEESCTLLSWYTSATGHLWKEIDPVWDGDFYDNGFHRALSYAGTILNRSTPEARDRINGLVEPILDRLRALTATLKWQELGISQRVLDNAKRSFMNGELETIRFLTYPEVDSRLDRTEAVAYFTSPLSEDDGSIAPVLSGPVYEMLWDHLSRTVLAMTITVDHWERSVERADHDNWLGKRLGKPLGELTAEEYLSMLMPLAERYRQLLDSLLLVVHQEPVTRLQEALIDFFGLPFWADRWFLYELWTLCRVLTLAASKWPVSLQGVERRKDDIIEWQLPGGLARQPVAVIGQHGEIECWTQRKTLHPDNGEGLEPDLRITRSGPDHPDVFIVENKDRRKPRKKEMAEILERYVSGTSARCVCLINYETFTQPTHNLPTGVPGREVLIVSHFRPPKLPPDFALRLMRILEEELGGQNEVAPLSSDSAKADFIEVTLEWGDLPNDLDLHAWVERADGKSHIYFGSSGILEEPPYAQLGDDIQLAPGQETLKIRSVELSHAVIAVHRFSPGVIGHARARIHIDGVRGGPYQLSLSRDADGAWWHVAAIRGNDLSLTLLDVVVNDPPVTHTSPL